MIAKIKNNTSGFTLGMADDDADDTDSDDDSDGNMKVVIVHFRR